jgi:hypothetical protein
MTKQIKLKSLLKEGYAWERKPGKPLPTIQEVMDEYEAKQETEEVPVKELGKKDFIDGAKWQAGKMYSEEEVYNLLLKLPNFINMSDTQKREEKREWFEQYKKK